MVGSVSVHFNFIIMITIIFMVGLSFMLQTAKQGKKDKHKVGQKRQQKMKKGSDADSDASSEEDGYLDSKEMDYLSDSSSSSEGRL